MDYFYKFYIGYERYQIEDVAYLTDLVGLALNIQLLKASNKYDDAKNIIILQKGLHRELNSDLQIMRLMY
jgi:hypothetical protein